MITLNEAYFLGLIYSKGDIIEIGNKIKFKINIKFRRPDDEALRIDNVYTVLNNHDDGREKLGSRFSNDFFLIKKMLKDEFNLNFDLILNNATGSDWDMKIISLISDEIKNDDEKFTKLFCTDILDSTCLKRFPFDLNIETSKPVSLSFVQGVCDACSLVPNEASSQNGGDGDARIQLEPSQERWELCIGLCKIFQLGLNIRVNNINWGHPQIRTKWRGQNHQFRVKLSDIPTDIELYRLEYKREEYHNLYERRGIVYSSQRELCPLKKKGIHRNMNIELERSYDLDLNSDLLHEKLRGISVDVSGKKSLLVCYLLGCERCRDYINVSVESDEVVYDFSPRPALVIAEDDITSLYSADDDLSEEN